MGVVTLKGLTGVLMVNLGLSLFIRIFLPKMRNRIPAIRKMIRMTIHNSNIPKRGSFLGEGLGFSSTFGFAGTSTFSTFSTSFGASGGAGTVTLGVATGSRGLGAGSIFFSDAFGSFLERGG